MAGPESRLRGRIIKALRKRGGLWWVVHGGEFQQVGLSDIMGLYQGVFYALEVKRPGEPHPPTAQQLRFLKKVGEAGAVGAIVHSVDEALEISSGQSK